jgi:benzylsuccinate CoA-transferase BbsF subunit
MDWARDPALGAFAARMARREEIDRRIGEWTGGQECAQIVATLRAAGVPADQVARPADRIDNDPRTAAWGLWPTVHHEEIGETRVEGIPVHMSETDWSISRGAPFLGADNDYVYGSLLGLSSGEIADFQERGVI